MRLLPFFGALTAVTLLTACGSTPAVEPTAPSATHDDQASSSSSIPTVTDPIDPSPWEEEPCTVLGSQQQDKLSIDTEPETRSGSTGPTCEWGHHTDDGVTLRGSFSTDVDGSIKGLYKNDELDSYAYFNPTTINGHPAFFADLADGRDNGGRGIYIAPRDDYSASTVTILIMMNRVPYSRTPQRRQ